MTWPDDIRETAQDSADFPHLAMPLGGIGTGNIAVCADGGLRQWQLHNAGNHDAALPASFFAIRVSRLEPPLDVIRVLQGPTRESTRTPLVTDDVSPEWQRRLLAAHPGVARTTFAATYPVARLAYHDPALPLQIQMEAFNPLVPLDVDASSVPAAMFTFRLANQDSYPLHGCLGIALQNSVGWDGISPIDGVTGAGYGGNINRLLRRPGWTTVALENWALAEDDPAAGQMAVTVDDAAVAVLRQWRRDEEFFAFLRSRALANGEVRLAFAPGISDPQRHAARCSDGASPSGDTWNTALAVPFGLEPGGERVIRVALTWHFPNRYVNFEQFGPGRPEWGKSRFWLGNWYTTKYRDALDVVDRIQSDWATLRERTGQWTQTLAESGLDDASVMHLAAQLATIRSPTCFRAADGSFYGFEGVLGASTVMWSGRYGGSCPLNCTHVWNYDQTLAKVFPELARDMRRTEFDVMQSPDGYLPHRVIVPSYLRQLWGEPIGGPDQPALDGMLGAVLKTYREYRAGAGVEWLQRFWPSVVRLMSYVDSKWNVDGTGMLSGIQPSTHDIDLAGHNPYIGTLWLAALRAAEEMARIVGDPCAVERFRAAFTRASVAYDDCLFNGEYYVQKLRPADITEHQWNDGCLSDQLIGQWWAHQLDLGYVLPADHVRTALSAIVRHNLRRGFREFAHPYRVFADHDDTGLLLCTWPRGGRPAVPIRYADEVWTGSEYQVAAHCLWEGLADEATAILGGLWSRYDGTRRNPYNQVECGDHYARALAGWSVLESVAGFRLDANAGLFQFNWPGQARPMPFLASTGWGLCSVRDEDVCITCTGGHIELHILDLVGARPTGQPATLTGTALPSTSSTTLRGMRIQFGETVLIQVGQTLTVGARSW